MLKIIKQVITWPELNLVQTRKIPANCQFIGPLKTGHYWTQIQQVNQWHESLRLFFFWQVHLDELVGHVGRIAGFGSDGFGRPSITIFEIEFKFVCLINFSMDGSPKIKAGG